MSIIKRIYRAKKGIAILAVVLYVPRRRQHRISEHVDPRHDVEKAKKAEKAEKAIAAQVNVAFKFDRSPSYKKVTHISIVLLVK